MASYIQSLIRICFEIQKVCDNKNFTLGEGPLSPKGIIVGEALGAEEEIQMRPFVGRSGQLLRKTISSFADVNEFFFTNVVHFRPENNRTPTDQEISFYGKFTREVVLALGCKNIMLVGNVPKNFAKKFSITLPEYNVVENYHPAFILRRHEFKDFFCNKIKEFCDLCFTLQQN